MTTEIQIDKNRRYLPYLKTVFNTIASRIDLNSSDIKTAEQLLSKACFSNSDSDEIVEGKLIIRFNAECLYMTIEILDTERLTNSSPVCEFHSEFITNSENIASYKSMEGRIIRISNPRKTKPQIVNRTKLTSVTVT